MKISVRLARCALANPAEVFENRNVRNIGICGNSTEQQKHKRQHKRPACARDNLAHHILADDSFVSALGFFVHKAVESRLAAECQRRERIHYEVYPQNLDNVERRSQVEQRADERNQHRSDVDCKLENDELSDRIEDCASVKYRLVDRVEVVVKDNDIGSLLCDLRAAAHRKTDVGFLQRGRVVYAVARHTRDKVKLLRYAHQTALV